MKTVERTRKTVSTGREGLVLGDRPGGEVRVEKVHGPCRRGHA
jgi:hypothetical protein